MRLHKMEKESQTQNMHGTCLWQHYLVTADGKNPKIDPPVTVGEIRVTIYNFSRVVIEVVE